MGDTPGQDSSPRTIDAKALKKQLIEFMRETALRPKRVRPQLSGESLLKARQGYPALVADGARIGGP